MQAVIVEPRPRHLLLLNEYYALFLPVSLLAQIDAGRPSGRPRPSRPSDRLPGGGGSSVPRRLEAAPLRLVASVGPLNPLRLSGARTAMSPEAHPNADQLRDEIQRLGPGTMMSRSLPGFGNDGAAPHPCRLSQSRLDLPPGVVRRAPANRISGRWNCGLLQRLRHGVGRSRRAFGRSARNQLRELRDAASAVNPSPRRLQTAGRRSRRAAGSRGLPVASRAVSDRAYPDRDPRISAR